MVNTTDMAHMFKNCTNLNYIPVYYWNLNNVTNMEQAFELCDSLDYSVINNIANKLPNANQLTNNSLVNIGIPLGKFSASQLYNLENKGYLIEEYPFDPMYTVIYDLGDGEEHTLLVNKGLDLDPYLSKAFSNIAPFRNSIVNLKISENYRKNATVAYLSPDMNNYRNLKKLDFSELNLSNIHSLGGYAKFKNNPNLIEIDFGNYQFNFTSMDDMFAEDTNLSILNWSNDVVFNSYYSPQLSNTFYRCTNLKAIPGIENWDMSKVYLLRNTFCQCYNLTSLNLSNWNVSTLQVLNCTFYSCTNLTSLNLSNWNVSRLQALDSTFSYCTNLTSLNLSNWNLSAITRIGAWLSACYNLEKLDCSNMIINNHWIGLAYIFHGCGNKATNGMNINLNNWNINWEAVTNVYGMFYSSGIYDLNFLNANTFNPCNVTNFGYMFSSCPKLTNIDISNWSFNTGKNSYFADMFRDCENITDFKFGEHDIQYANASGMFCNCVNLTNVDFGNSHFNVYDCCYMFSNCINLVNMDITKLSFCNNTNIDGMFNNCTRLDNLNLSNLDFSQTNSVRYIINSCKNINHVNLCNANFGNCNVFLLGENYGANSVDLSNINLGNCITFAFSNIYNVKKIDLSNANIGKLSASWLVSSYASAQIEILNLSNANFSNMYLNNMLHCRAGSYWAGLSTLTELNLTNTILKPGTSLNQLFSGYRYLTKIDMTALLNFNKTSGLDSTFMNCTNLVDIINIDNLDISSVATASYMFSGSGVNNISFLYKFNNTRVRTLNGMYSNCLNLTNIYLCNLNLENCNSISDMFIYCKNVEDLTIDNLKLNVSYSCTNWFMLGSSATNLRNLTIRNLSGSNYNILRNITLNSSLETINITLDNLSNIDITQLEFLNFAGFGLGTNSSLRDINYNLNNIVCNNRKILSLGFSNCTNLTNVNINTNNVDIQKLSLSGSFRNCKNITDININWSNHVITSVRGCFDNCSNMTSIDINNWNIQLNNMYYIVGMFNNCVNLVDVDLSNIKIECNIRDYSSSSSGPIFSYCDKLSDKTIDSVINMCLNITNLNTQYKNLSIDNYYSIFNTSIITNDRYQNRWDELRAAGWSF